MRHVRIGGGIFLPETAIEEYLAANMIEPMVSSLAEKFGIDPAQASQFLAEHLPQLIASQHGSQAG